ncbi:hypothetical protein HispidOSU_016706 [Sigmodon hispidus]
MVSPDAHWRGGGGSEAGPERVRGAGLQCRFPGTGADAAAASALPVAGPPPSPGDSPDPGKPAQGTKAWIFRNSWTFSWSLCQTQVYLTLETELPTRLCGETSLLRRPPGKNCGGPTFGSCVFFEVALNEMWAVIKEGQTDD